MTFTLRFAPMVVCSAALIAVFPAPADACTCVGSREPCESLWVTPAVFSGLVLSVTPGSPGGPEGMADRVVRFQVDEAWRGGVSGVVELHTASSGAACGYAFVNGQRYLVYADQRGGQLSVNLCSRTRPLAAAAEDLAYLKSTAQPSAAGRIFGLAIYQSQKASERERPVSGYGVLLRSADREWKTTTGPDGRYEFRVPAGRYRIELVVPATERAYGPREIELVDARGCASGIFSVARPGV